jgi:Flp pilus assembly protein TadD/V8-like Glu-specific endopeptidase
MRYPIIFGVAATVALVQAHPTFAKSNVEVSRVAKPITVKISTSDDTGSGVIIKREGNTYTILTAAHVVSAREKVYTINTSDGQQHQLQQQMIKPFPNKIDLAVVKFTSTNTYPVAKIGSSSQAEEGASVYATGFPAPTRAISAAIYAFKDGKVIAESSQDLEGGYGIVYSCNTLPGMSGGGIFNENGELIAIHGKGDVDEKFKPSQENENVRFKTGNDLGIPIDTFVRLARNVGVNTGIAPPAVVAKAAPTAADLFVAAVAKEKNNDYRGVLADLEQAVKIDPKFARGYYGIGTARARLGDNRGAIADYERAIQLNPNFANAYDNRGIARARLGDNRGAIADFERAIQLNPNFAQAYDNRGIARARLGDKQGAIADYERAIQLNPNFAQAYDNRGAARVALGDNRGAIVDFERAIQLNPNDAKAYVHRGVVHAALGDNRGAIADLQTAANLFDRQGNKKLYQLAIDFIKKIQAADPGGF